MPEQIGKGVIVVHIKDHDDAAVRRDLLVIAKELDRLFKETGHDVVKLGVFRESEFKR